MKTLTNKESEALLLIFKDYNTNYNANSISKKISITPRGALKVLKNLHKEKLLVKKQFGKAVFYKVNLEDEYTKKIMDALLMGESREKAARWISEFEEIGKEIHVAVIFGSAIRNYNGAKDIDILLVFDKNKFRTVSNFIADKNKILIKPIHAINMTLPDLTKNLQNKNPAMINAIREGYVLFGHEKVIEVIKNVTKF